MRSCVFPLVLSLSLLWAGAGVAQQPQQTQPPQQQPQPQQPQSQQPQPQQRPQAAERSVKVQAGKDARIAVFVNIRNDCTSGPLPTIKLQLAPTRGKVTIKNAKVRATNLKHCLAIEVPAYVAFYRVDQEFAGTEVLELEVTDAGGNKRVQRLSISIGKSATGENI